MLDPQKEKVLLMWRKNHGHEYYVFPGGGVEDNETIEDAVLREVKEETMLDAKLGRLLYTHHYVNDSDQFFFEVIYTSGEPKLGDANEKEAMKNDKDDYYEPLWIEIEKLKELLVYPLEIRDWLIEDVANNFLNTPRVQTTEVKDVRHSL